MAKVKKICVVCKKEYEVYPSKSDRSKCCSRECAQIYAANSPAKKTGEYKKCIYCGKSYYRNKFSIERSGEHESKYCSRKCKDRHHSEIHVGELSNLYKNGKYQGKGINWYPQRELARQRDKGICQICGVKTLEIKGAHHLKSDVHHIMPFKYFDDYIKANDLSNLICLCHKCHSKVHNEARKTSAIDTTHIISYFKDNPEPSQEGNNLEGATTRTEA